MDFLKANCPKNKPHTDQTSFFLESCKDVHFMDGFGLMKLGVVLQRVVRFNEVIAESFKEVRK